MEKRVQDYTQEILSVIKSNASPTVMSSRLETFHASDLADVMTGLTVQERCKLYRILDKDVLSDIFEYTDSEHVAEYMKEIDLKKGAAILSGMETDVLAEVLHSMEKTRKKLLLELLEPEVRRDIELIASFEEDEIGSRMTTNCIVIRENLTVKQAMSTLVSQAAKNDNISTIFVVTESQKFYGAIDLKDLIIAREGTALDDLVVTSYPYVYAEESIDDCIEELKAYSEDSIPVLNNENCLLGVITSANIIDLVDDEMGEDYAMLAGLTAEEDLKEPLKASMKKRMPWLIILLALGMVVSSVVGVFESVVTQLPIIMAFQSLILDMAGNVGTQSLAVTIRVLMDESLTGRQKLDLVWKEIRVGLCNGSLLGGLSFLVVGVFIWLFKGNTVGFAFSVSACIGTAMLLAMLISSAVGTCIPLLFKKIGVDPAVASGPLITTVNDLVAVVTYYGLSWLFLIEFLHLAG